MKLAQSGSDGGRSRESVAAGAGAEVEILARFGMLLDEGGWRIWTAR